MTGQQERAAPAIRYPTMRLRLPDSAALAPYLEQIDSNRWYTNFGPLAARLAERLAARYGVESAGVSTMANGTLALTVALQESVEKRPGTQCLLPSWTFAASAHAARASGLDPCFADVDPRSGQLTPGLAEMALAGRRVGAVMVVSPFGHPVDPKPWERFRDAHDIDVVIDGAGAFDSVEAATIPTVVSMHATKPVTAAEGAFAIARDTDLIERLRRRSNFGFDSGRSAQRIGLNAKMSEYHAAVGLASLDSWPVRRARLMAVAGQYRESLAELPEASLQEGWGERWIGTTLSIRLTGCGDAAALCDRLACAGVEARQWWRGCHRDPAFAAFDRMPLPGTESLARTTLALPFFEDLTPADIESIVQRLKDLLSRGR